MFASDIFDLGDIVYHKLFGKGEVMIINGVYVSVLFGTEPNQRLEKVHMKEIKKSHR